MHIPKPLSIPEVIAITIKKLPVKDLDNCINLNQIRYKEICRELYMRRNQLMSKQWELESLYLLLW